MNSETNLFMHTVLPSMLWGLWDIHSLNSIPKNWKEQLKQLQKIDWLRSNEKVWEGRAMNNGRISKAQMNLTLTANYLKQVMNLPLTTEEEKVEKRFLKQTHGKV